MPNHLSVQRTRVHFILFLLLLDRSGGLLLLWRLGVQFHTSNKLGKVERLHVALRHSSG